MMAEIVKALDVTEHSIKFGHYEGERRTAILKSSTELMMSGLGRETF